MCVFLLFFVFFFPLLYCSIHFASLLKWTSAPLPPPDDTNPTLTERDSTMYSAIVAALRTPGAAILFSPVTYPECSRHNGTLGRWFFYLRPAFSTNEPLQRHPGRLSEMAANLGGQWAWEAFGQLGKGTCVAMSFCVFDVTAAFKKTVSD